MVKSNLSFWRFCQQETERPYCPSVSLLFLDLRILFPAQLVIRRLAFRRRKEDKRQQTKKNDDDDGDRDLHGVPMKHPLIQIFPRGLFFAELLFLFLEVIVGCQRENPLMRLIIKKAVRKKSLYSL